MECKVITVCSRECTSVGSGIAVIVSWHESVLRLINLHHRDFAPCIGESNRIRGYGKIAYPCALADRDMTIECVSICRLSAVDLSVVEVAAPVLSILSCPVDTLSGKFVAAVKKVCKSELEVVVKLCSDAVA